MNHQVPLTRGSVVALTELDFDGKDLNKQWAKIGHKLRGAFHCSRLL